MCGIVGYIGNKEATPLLYNGMKRLEYRGYDSAGIAVNNGNKINIIKESGNLSKLKKLIDNKPPLGNIGIGHTRWATHGKPTDINAHPHQDCSGDFVIVHNGIIENFTILKEELIKTGHEFVSETDTEVIVHLIEEQYNGNLLETANHVSKRLKGSYALLIMSRKEPDKIIVVRKDSPLVLGIGENENFIASDIPAFLEFTDQFYLLKDNELASVGRDKIKIFDNNLNLIKRDIFKVDWNTEMSEKNGYEHFMLKEINEQPDALRRVLNKRVSASGINLDELELTIDEINKYDKINIVACGTAYHAGLIAKYLIEELARLAVEVDVASEFRYRKPILDKNSLVIVVSQSGETADTLAALRLAQEKGATVLALTNVMGSSISREADKILYLKAGPEIAVASTKAYIVMLAAFYMLAIYIAKLKDEITAEREGYLIENVLKLPELAARTIKINEDKIKKLAKNYKDKKNIFFIGRNTDYTLAMEGALKLKEISYIHAEAYPAGELKHGTLALIEDGIPVFAIATRKEIFEKTMSNIKEVDARGGEVTAVVYEDMADKFGIAKNYFAIPKLDELFSGVLSIIPLQQMAYYIAVERDCEIDQPRNLAKSVTVE